MKEVDIEAEKQIVRERILGWFEAENQKDVDSVMGFLSEDMIIQAPDIPQLVGKETIREFFSEWFQSGLVSVKGNPTRTEVSTSGDLAYNLGTSRSVLNGPEGYVEETTKYLTIWKQIEGEWKCVAASFNRDNPTN